MRVEYSKRALSDVRNIAAFYANSDSPSVGEAVETRIQEIVDRLAQAPRSGRSVAERPNVRVVPLLRYPWNVFYTFSGEVVRIVHIRHSSRRPWTGG
jgi:toxin ParE1/3/4